MPCSRTSFSDLPDTMCKNVLLGYSKSGRPQWRLWLGHRPMFSSDKCVERWLTTMTKISWGWHLPYNLGRALTATKCTKKPVHVQSCCFALLTNCFFDVLQGLLSLSYHLLCVQTRNKITKHVVPWSLDIPWWKQACSSEYPQKCRNQIALQWRCSEYATQAYYKLCLVP